MGKNSPLNFSRNFGVVCIEHFLAGTCRTASLLSPTDEGSEDGTKDSYFSKFADRIEAKYGLHKLPTRKRDAIPHLCHNFGAIAGTPAMPLNAVYHLIRQRLNKQN